MGWPLSWRMSWMLFTIAASASIIASDSPAPISSYEGTLMLQDLGAKRNISELVPLTRDALLRNRTPLEGDLVYVNESTVTLLRDHNVAYISCDLDRYSRNSTDPALDLFKQAMNIVNLSGAIFFSTQKNYCSYTEIPVLLQEFPVYSMTDRGISAQVLDRVDDMNPAIIYMINIGSVGPRDPQSQPQNNPLGPSPTTAVAMIILYSITGIITALFLVIIITGAVRAHRHPERYGPRDILGRPRQSRARGLGRAILDTIPIVKFGEREPQKPTDVELGSAREASDAEPGHAEPGQEQPGASQEQREAQVSEAAARTASPGQPETTPTEPVEEPSGIAPAIPTTTAEEEHLECSICTEDFVKGQDLRVLPCGHKFHPECVDPWLLNVSGTCPLCRVDLRPGSSRSSSSSTEIDQTGLAPPLHPDDSEAAHRRRSGLRDILLFRTRPNASAEERISALRRLRDQRRSEQAAIAGEPGHAESSAEAAADARRSRRFSARLSDVFGARARRQHGSQEREGRQEGQGSRERDGGHEEEQEATMTAAGAVPSPERDAEIIDSIVEPESRRRLS